VCLKWSLYFTACFILLPKPLILEPFGNLAAFCKEIMSVLCTDLSAGGTGGLSGVCCLDHYVLPSILNKTAVLHRVLVLRQEAMEQSRPHCGSHRSLVQLALAAFAQGGVCW